jgi:hypothetical protein
MRAIGQENAPLRRDSSDYVITWNVKVYKIRRERNTPFNFRVDVSLRKHYVNGNDDHTVQPTIAPSSTTMLRYSQTAVTTAGYSRSIFRLLKTRQPLLPSGVGTENPVKTEL